MLCSQAMDSHQRRRLRRALQKVGLRGSSLSFQDDQKHRATIEQERERLSKIPSPTETQNRLLLVGGLTVSDILLICVVESVKMSALYKWLGLTVSFTLFLIILQEGVGKLRCRPTKQRIIAIVVLTVAFILVAIWPALAEWRIEKSGALEGDLRGCFSKHCENEGPLMLEIGDSGGGVIFVEDMEQPPGSDMSAIEGANSFTQLAYDAGIRLNHGEHGLEITTTIKNKNGDTVVDVDKNHWKVIPPYFYDKNYTQNVLEVKDNRKHVVLWIRILEDRVQIQGEWRDEFGNGVRLLRCQPSGNKEMGCTDKSRNSVEEQHYENDMIEPMFEYPSKDNWGKMRKVWPLHP